ncbi:Glutamate 5-kinase [Savitreella phatthalungensis]
MGLRRMKLPKRPKELAKKQAMAAIGQCRLIALWDTLFMQLHQPVAQILLTRNDIADRSQYLNAKNTLRELLNMDVIPIVNENDTLAVSEIKFGDNDTLSAITAAMVSADYLFLMTDVDCLYTDNPRSNPDAVPIETITDFSLLQADVSGAGSSVGTGGMLTKITAAKLASSAGVMTIITRGSAPNNIVEIVDGLSTMHEAHHLHVPKQQLVQTDEAFATAHEVQACIAPAEDSPGSASTANLPLHTKFLPLHRPVRDRHIWLLHGLYPEGKLVIDAGAYRALTGANKAGLLPAGIVAVHGSFAADSCVALCVELDLLEAVEGAQLEALSDSARPSTARSANAMGLPGSPTVMAAAAAMKSARSASDNPVTPTTIPHDLSGRRIKEVGRCLTNYSSVEIERIKRHHSHDISQILGYSDTEYVAHRDNLAFYKLT